MSLYVKTHGTAYKEDLNPNPKLHLIRGKVEILTEGFSASCCHAS